MPNGTTTMGIDGAHSSPLLLLARVNALQAWRRLKAVREQSRLLTVIIALFMSGYWVFSFWLFYKGLKFVAGYLALGGALTERLMYLLFAFLFAMLLLSNVVIGYTNLFRNRETSFLMSLPLPAQSIFRWKFIESLVLASWAFAFLIAPLLAAFGLTQHVPWHFYPATILLIGLFIILPGVGGAWVALNLGRYLDRRSFQVCVLIAAVAALVLARDWWSSNRITDEMLETRVLGVLDQLLQRTNFSQFPFLPSYWLSASVLRWSEGALTLAGFFALVLLSNAAFFGFLAFTRVGGLFTEAASAVNSRGSVLYRWSWFRAAARRRATAVARPGPLERAVGWLRWLGPDTQALLVKDSRMFWRDTTQWGQSVLLLGILSVYLMNLRQFTSQLTNPYWVHLVAHLNLGACSLNLAMLTTRFVYPQFSLEGQRLWIIGLAPMGLARVVKAKFWLATCTALSITLSLMVLSCSLLKLDWRQMTFFCVVIVVMAFTLNGLAMGMGVLYPNFKETNPGKIVSGFGGTFCFVLSFLYVLISVLALAFSSGAARNRIPSPVLGLAGICVFSALSFVLGWIPFKLSLRQIRQFEF